MAGFRYSLQNILQIKDKLETQAKQEFSMAQGELLNRLEEKERLVSRRRQYEEEAIRLRNGTLDLLKMEENKEAILIMDSYIARQELAVEEAREAVEKAREKMTFAMRERKTYETLKDQAFEAFQKEENSKEGRTIDELVSYTYGQKRQVTNGGKGK